jgi:hypothetical protein
MVGINTANNYVAGDCHPLDMAGSKITKKSTNTGGVHQEHVLVDGLTPGACSKVAVGSVSAQSGAIAGSVVRLVPSTNCHVAFGANPTAAADGSCVYLPAGSVNVFAFTSGQKIAVIEDAAAGVLFITALS